MITFFVLCGLAIVGAFLFIFEYKEMIKQEKSDEAKSLDEITKRCKDFKDKEK